MDKPKSFQWKGEPIAAEPTIRQVPAEQPAKRRRRPRFRIRFRIRLRYVLLGLLVLALCGVGAGWRWYESLDIGKLALPVAAPTELLDVHGKVASVVSVAKTEPVPIDKIPVSLRHAVVAVEDKRFYDHSGVDVTGIVRAAFRNAKSGASAEGGSTITQQLAKNVFLTGEKSFKRKITEAAYAIKIEAAYDKDAILDMYLNQIYFGEGQWGVARAAKRYFGKSVQDLTLPESALLAALPKAPSRYSPYRNPDLALERRNLVLAMMRDEGYISDAEYRAAKAEPIQLRQGNAEGNGLLGKYGSFADAVIDEAIDRYGFTERDLMAGNLKIYTTLDPSIQEAMEKTYRDDGLFPAGADGERPQSGAVILNPHTGGVRGIVGQRGEHVFRGFNRATQLTRQPGSTFKPLAVYAPALLKGYTAESALYDGPLDIGGYRPQNIDGQSHGQPSLRDALAHSWNVPAVWLLNEIGVTAGWSFAKKLGIPLTAEDKNLSLALGGLSHGVSPLQMAQAFGAFPALGKVTPAHTILRIENAEGEVLAEAKEEAASVMPAGKAYEMTELLQNVVSDGTGKKAAIPGRPTAGKTGTTQLPDTAEFKGVSGAKDAWFVGYTPELVGAVWLGYDRTDASHYLTTSGGEYPAMIFQAMMSAALQGEPASAFKNPGGNQTKPNAVQQKEPKKEQKKETGKEKRKNNKGKNKHQQDD